MSYSVSEVLTGAAVLAVAAGFVLYASGEGPVSRGGQEYELMASFRSAEGITVGTDVRMAGVKIGRVIDLRLNPQTYRADATFTVDGAIAVPDDSTAIIASEGLLGGSYLEIQPGGSPMNLEPGTEIENTQGAVSLISLMMKFADSKSSSDTVAP
ncbi:phospholipid/cholesterol/gamma-HCH transport system substrate-binding protein [Albidovulum inexpectatum]|uniref:Phospholipid/cholesterol/gamma-HCH transport system substrate-binding protein n=1 Tax=Albidovulum inexpectatum TaxID=196587 RepID=A0A2S5JI57_9RHOB|nr:outer membrane lipid asymmetry maintenance protein MlaD [Albidovulum inexpectatum]PPB81207.1 phospholipid/cholesterol/gamma-HCH transport system substrate-binding protein [Albidovulum inexpectatum]